MNKREPKVRAQHMEGHQFLVVGRHVWARCQDCGKLIKLTGWTRGIHLCTEDT